MKPKKRFLVVIFIIIFVIVIALNTNDILLFRMMLQFENILTNESNFKILDKASVCGKLNGNGNGVQFFGAVLIEVNSEESVIQIANQLSEYFEEASYVRQQNNTIQSRHLEHRTLKFSYTQFSAEKIYYMVYFYESNHDLASLFDLDAH